MSSTSLDKEKAAELISQFEQQQRSQLAILRTLHGLQDDQDEKPSKSDGESDSKKSGKNRACHPPLNLKHFPAGYDISKLSMPAEWAPGWSDSLLKERIEERRGNPGCDNDGRAQYQVDMNDPAVKFIENEVLQDFADFTDAGPNGKTAFYVLDKGVPIEDDSPEEGCRIIMPKDLKPKPLPDVTKERSVTAAFGRHIIIQAFTPSAIAAVFLTAPKHPTHDYSSLYASMRRHLSTDIRDRFYYDAHSFSTTESRSDIVSMGSVSVSYFALWPEKPAQSQSPLSPTGIFGTEGPSQQYIREQKLTFAFLKNGWGPGTSVAATFGAMTVPGVGMDESASLQLTNNLRHLWWKWEKVLDHLDAEISLPSTVIFDQEWQRDAPSSEKTKLAKKYFWALETLLVFEDFISETLRHLDRFTGITRQLDGSTPSEWEEGMQKKNFTEIQERIVQKRKLVESLNNAYSSALGINQASSVSE